MSTQTGEQLGALLAETSRVWRHRLDVRLRPLGLSQTRWILILQLSKAEGGLAQSELATRLGISQASLSAQIERMVRDGWVERHASAGDRRCKTINLTEQARSLSRSIRQTAATLRDELLEGLAEDDIAACEQVLKHILQRAQSL
ncbi:MarR family winged helix-turn-helix transcriptional regulator [Acidihalobacter ferrooxydans]|uniref:HTH marR-type domain-containing protein n=1 Tax=Acidihalobacter ferrooxydans TaxID=1765967 RepID=A0A1P8UKR2_9GAMM|nr:MarR family transcriptional regulator [Acidihalobacter ferrooxydans]APZ44395.1 hypothetical protein BW247_15930 [Acidihalobacter ferrooxydans]